MTQDRTGWTGPFYAESEDATYWEPLVEIIDLMDDPKAGDTIFQGYKSPYPATKFFPSYERFIEDAEDAANEQGFGENDPMEHLRDNTEAKMEYGTCIRRLCENNGLTGFWMIEDVDSYTLTEVDIEAAKMFREQNVAGVRGTTETIHSDQIAAGEPMAAVGGLTDVQIGELINRYAPGFKWDDTSTLSPEALRSIIRDVYGRAWSPQSTLAFDLVAYIGRLRKWSERVMGPGKNHMRVIKHLRKELDEIEAAPDDLIEWVDVIILAIDGAWRQGYAPEQIANAIVAKQARNEARTWPDWRDASPDTPIEHVRTGGEA